jgi:probable F420-dependent oxidoreductase
MCSYAQQVELLGFESLSLVEHSVVISGYASRYPYDSSGRMAPADDCPIPDPIDVLSFVAATTEHLELATSVMVLPNHHPVVLAKRLATVDALSRGRVRLAVGVGWMREEIEACGGDFARRGRWTDESIEAMRLLWSETGPDGCDYMGTLIHFERAMSYPKPYQGRSIPIHIGGHSRAAATRAGRLGDGFQPLGVHGADLDGLLEIMRAAATATDRDPNRIQVTLTHSVDHITRDKVDALASRGVTRLNLVSPQTRVLNEALDHLHACADRLDL